MLTNRSLCASFLWSGAAGLERARYVPPPPTTVTTSSGGLVSVSHVSCRLAAAAVGLIEQARGGHRQPSYRLSYSNIQIGRHSNRM